MINGVKDCFVNDMLKVGKHPLANKQRNIRIRTELIQSYLEEFLANDFEMYLPLKQQEDVAFISEYLSKYLFGDYSEQDIMTEYDIDVAEFEASYKHCLKGFKELYSEDLI